MNDNITQDINQAAKELGRKGGLATARNKSKEYYQEKAKVMNEVKRRKKSEALQEKQNDHQV